MSLTFSPFLFSKTMSQIGVFTYTLPSKVWRLCSCTIGINISALPLTIQSIWKSLMTISSSFWQYKHYQWSLCGDLRVIWAPYDYASRLHEVILYPLSLRQSCCVQALQTKGLGVSWWNSVKGHRMKDKVFVSPLHIERVLMKTIVYEGLGQIWYCLPTPMHSVPTSQFW